MATILANEFSHLAATGRIDLHLFSELCSNIITNRFQVARYQRVPGEPWKQTLPAYIAAIIRASNYGMSVAVAALTLVARYQDTFLLRSSCCAGNVEDACRLVLVAYIVAVKVMKDEQPSLKFWKWVAGEEYSCPALSMLEMQFYDMVDWSVHIDPVAYAMTSGELMESYPTYTPARRLPESPPPSYQTMNKRETVVKAAPKAAPVMFLSEGREELHVLDEKNEDLFARALVSPAALKVEQRPQRS